MYVRYCHYSGQITLPKLKLAHCNPTPLPRSHPITCSDIHDNPLCPPQVSSAGALLRRPIQRDQTIRQAVRISLHRSLLQLLCRHS